MRGAMNTTAWIITTFAVLIQVRSKLSSCMNGGAKKFPMRIGPIWWIPPDKKIFSSHERTDVAKAALGP